MALIGGGWVGGRRRVGVWEGDGGSGGRWASWRRALPAIRPHTVVLCSQQMAGMYTNHRMDRDGHWQQFGTHPIMISAPQWANRPCNAPTQLYRVGKKPSVKADMGIYSHVFDVLGQCMREPLIIRHNLDFNSCDIMVSFCKSNHKSSSICAHQTKLQARAFI